MMLRPGWGDRRVAMQTTQNFSEWSDPELLLQMDPMDQSATGFYAMPVVPVGKMYVGLLWNFNNASSRLLDSFNLFYGNMNNQLCYSLDGVRFNRGLRQPFIDLNPYPDHGCTQIRTYSIINQEDQVLFYSGASRAPHGLDKPMTRKDMQTKALIMHRMRKDGWMYLQSKGHWAKILTKPFALFSDSIQMNAQAPYGEVRYQVTDERSRPIEGFTYDNCRPLKAANQLKYMLSWDGA